eukprot:TRINITY_DN5729_c0_g1_i13.p1 TRINITY_DN5729_c0_g1~~TRINITY_DN5729_c0_g1_i13.p1  ORF type:complete len:168 (-),score=3.79 TRINITY_DN5729_c0_g1_i13:39-542(-)
MQKLLKKLIFLASVFTLVASVAVNFPTISSAPCSLGSDIFPCKIFLASTVSPTLCFITLCTSCSVLKNICISLVSSLAFISRTLTSEKLTGTTMTTDSLVLFFSSKADCERGYCGVDECRTSSELTAPRKEKFRLCTPACMRASNLHSSHPAPVSYTHLTLPTICSV